MSRTFALPASYADPEFTVPLSNPRQVHTLLERAQSRRAVAATLMNERSSRSHSVFTLKVRGVNPLTDEKCEAMLNLGEDDFFRESQIKD